MANLLTCYYRPKPGGLCKRLFRAINALLADGHTVHYLAVVPFPIQHPRCYFHRFPWNKNKTNGIIFWGIFHILTPLMLFFIGYKHQITHLFAFGHTYSFLMQPLHLIKKIPQTLFLRADTIKNHKLKSMPRFLIMIEKQLEGLALKDVRLYGVSKALTANVCLRHTYFKPLLTGTLPNDIKKLPEKFILNKNYNLPLQMACAGILEKRKNQSLLLNIMKNIQPDKAQLYLYGVGPDEKKLKQFVNKNKLTDRVHFMGWVESELIWKNVDLLLMPSLHEGSPNSVLEALKQNICILASNIPEHIEILPQKYLLSPYVKSEWIYCLQKIINDPKSILKNICTAQFIYSHQLYFDWDMKICKHILK